MIATAGLIILLAVNLLSVDAFEFAIDRRPPSRSFIHGRLPYPAAGSRWGKLERRTTIHSFPSRLFNNQSPSSQPTSLMATESNILHKITTGVGKTASTLVSVSFFLLLACQRDAIILTLWIGSILNAVLSKVAKKVLNHERPTALQDNDKVKLKPSDGGMPSSHAMSLGFIGTVIAGGIVPAEYRVMAALTMSTYSAIALRYRVKSHLHTVEQVAVGLVLGVGNALAWLKFGVGDSNAGPVLSWVQDNWVSSETGLFPYSALAIPVVVGILVVGSFERRISLWIKSKGKDD